MFFGTGMNFGYHGWERKFLDFRLVTIVKIGFVIFFFFSFAWTLRIFRLHKPLKAMYAFSYKIIKKKL